MAEYKIIGEENKFGISDSLGNIILDPIYFYIEWAGWENLYIVRQAVDDSFQWAMSLNRQHYLEGLFNAESHSWLLGCDYYCIWHFDPIQKRACVVERHNGHSSGFINEHGEFIIPPIYDMPIVERFDNYGRIPLLLGDKWGMLDANNNTKLPFEFDSIGYDYNVEYLKIKKNGKFGFANLNGEIQISPRYDSAIDFFFVEGHWRSIVEAGGQYYIINENGSRISSSYKSIRIRIGEKYHAEALCWSFLEGWKWASLSTITGTLE